MNESQLKQLIREEYHNVKTFMEEKYGFVPELGQVVSNPYVKSFTNEEATDNPCWDGYEMVGMKMKDGKEVPNCVPKNESVVTEDKIDVLRNYVQKINKKYKVNVSSHPVTKGEIEIILGSGNHPDSDYNTIEKLVSKLGIKKYSIFNESVNEGSVKNSEILDVIDSIQNLIKNLKNDSSKKNPKLFTAASPLVKELHKLLESVTEETKRDYKDEYKKFQSSDKSKKYRAELNKYNRDKGTYGNGDGKDASHKSGKIVGFEAESTNRGRAEKSRLKKESSESDADMAVDQLQSSVEHAQQLLDKLNSRSNLEPWVQSLITKAEDYLNIVNNADGGDDSIEEYDVENYQDVKEFVQFMKEYTPSLNEAEYQGRAVKLGKIMQGDVKKFKVYVNNDKGNVVKVNFGQKGMVIKKDNPAARKSFRARMNCDEPGPRWKANYWSCRKW
jgi:hypothetical protein